LFLGSREKDVAMVIVKVGRKEPKERSTPIGRVSRADSRLGLRSRIVHPNLEVFLVDSLLNRKVNTVSGK